MNCACRPIEAVRLLGAILAIGSSAVASAQLLTPNAPSTVEERVDERVENSVVHVFASVRYPDLGKPWTKQAPKDVTGTGVVVGGKHILTAAHVVLYASQVEVQASRAGDKLSARVEAIAPSIDLALLTVEDQQFFETHPPLPLDHRLPSIKEAILAYGFPSGGSTLSVTKGIVSRTEFVALNPQASVLRIQIDAAVNPGNSGGPAVIGDRMVGLVFSKLGGGAQNIGYIIPAEEIELFLADLEDGRYDGKPALYDELQTLENGALRPFLKLAPSTQGIIVRRPAGDDASYPLKRWDVVTRIGDAPIDDQGMVSVGGARLDFRYLVQKLAARDLVPLTIWRAGKETSVEVPVAHALPVLVPELKGSYPAYFVYGPLAFSPASSELVASMFSAKNNAAAWLSYTGSPLVTRRGDRAAFPGEELVVVGSPLFPHRLAKGYGNPAGQVVKTVNGVVVRNLRHLVEVLRDTREEFVTFEFASRYAEAIVLRRSDAVAATEEILNDNGIRAQGTPELISVWNGSRASKEP